MAVNWSLLQPVDVAGALNQGLERGKAQRREYETKSALAAFVQNPSDAAPIAALAQYDPAMALKLQDAQRERMVEQRRRDIGSQYAGGDRGGAQRAAISAGDFDLAKHFSGLDQAGIETADKRVKVIGEVARYADTPQKWDEGIDKLVALGYSDLAPYKGKFDPAMRDAAIAAAGQWDEHLASVAPKLFSGQPGAPVYDQNPNSPTYTPLGPTAAPSAPVQPGAVVNGQTFRGGDYRDPKNWSAGGAASQGAATFP